jgi:hypothetical protein
LQVNALREWLAAARADTVLAEALCRGPIPSDQSVADAVADAIVLDTSLPHTPVVSDDGQERSDSSGAAPEDEGSRERQLGVGVPELKRPASPEFLQSMATALEGATAAAPALRSACESAVSAAHGRVALLERLKVRSTFGLKVRPEGSPRDTFVCAC